MVYFSIYLSMARCIISCFFASHVFCVIKMESVRFFLIIDENGTLHCSCLCAFEGFDEENQEQHYMN